MGLLVTGMHRSGTSLVAALLHEAGLSLGDGITLIGANPSQPTGHFEATEVVALNDELLRILGTTWIAPRPPPAGAAEALANGRIGDQARALVEKSFAGADWVMKDPRFCLTLPFWAEVLDDGFELVVCVRHPAAVARSLRKRDGLPEELGRRLWRSYNSTLLRDNPGAPRALVRYDDLVDGPERVIKDLLSSIDLSGCPVDALEGVVVPDLRRSQRAGDALADIEERLWSLLVAEEWSPEGASMVVFESEPGDAVAEFAGRVFERAAEAEAESSLLRLELDHAVASHGAQIEEYDRGLSAQRAELVEQYDARIAALVEEYDARNERVVEEYDGRIAELIAGHGLQIEEYDRVQAGQRAELIAEYDSRIAALVEGHDSRIAELVDGHLVAVEGRDRAQVELVEEYDSRIHELLEAHADVSADLDRHVNEVVELRGSLETSSYELRAAHAERNLLRDELMISRVASAQMEERVAELESQLPSLQARADEFAVIEGSRGFAVVRAYWVIGSAVKRVLRVLTGGRA